MYSPAPDACVPLKNKEAEAQRGEDQVHACTSPGSGSSDSPKPAGEGFLLPDGTLTATPHPHFTDTFLFLLFSHWVVSDSLWPLGLQHARLPYPSLLPGACSNSCPLSRWCHPTISSSVAPFSSCLQSFPASSIRVSSSESALHRRWSRYWSFSVSISLSNEYSGLFPLGLTGLVSLQSKGLSKVFSSTTVNQSSLKFQPPN